MKAIVPYVVVLVGSAALGAAGMGAYTVLATGPSEQETEAQEVDGGDAGAGSAAAGRVRMAGAVGDGGPSETGGGPGAGEITQEAVTERGEDGGRVGPTDEATVQADEEAATGSDAGAYTNVGSTDSQIATADPDSLARLAQNYQRLARIFSAMKADEAAPVLAQLDDDQLEGILLAMQGRNAAPILAEMDPERAAALSRKVLRGNE